MESDSGIVNLVVRKEVESMVGEWIVPVIAVLFIVTSVRSLQRTGGVYTVYWCYALSLAMLVVSILKGSYEIYQLYLAVEFWGEVSPSMVSWSVKRAAFPLPVAGITMIVLFIVATIARRRATMDEP